MFLLGTVGTWFAGKFGKAAGILIEVIVALLLLVALIGGPYYLGDRNRGIKDEDAQRQALLAQAQEYEQKLAAGTAAAAQAQAGDASAQVVHDVIVKEVPRYVTRYIPAPGKPAQPLPPCVFTRGYVGLWNAAGSTQLPGDSSGAAAAGAPADPADAGLLDSGASQADILANHVDNATSCAADRRELSAILSLAHPGQ